MEHRVRPTLGLTVVRISQDIREDFQIPLLERVLHVLVTVEDSQVVRQSGDKLLKYQIDENNIPPEYLTDERAGLLHRKGLEVLLTGFLHYLSFFPLSPTVLCSLLKFSPAGTLSRSSIHVNIHILSSF